jgi:hypothetical protein
LYAGLAVVFSADLRRDHGFVCRREVESEADLLVDVFGVFGILANVIDLVDETSVQVEKALLVGLYIRQYVDPLGR